VTCVVGISTKRGSLIAFDSFASANGKGTVRRDMKGAQLTPEVAFGYTYSYRYGQIITHHLDLPPVETDPFAWAVQKFVPATRTALREHGWLKKENDREEAGQLILAVRNRVFVIHSDHSVQESTERYTAVGSGDEVALGAIEALLHARAGLTDEDIARAALQAAAKLCTGVRAPWHFLRTVIG
jgi:hypothetical protein